MKGLTRGKSNGGGICDENEERHVVVRFVLDIYGYVCFCADNLSLDLFYVK